MARAGLLKGARVAQYILQWAIASRDLGHAPSAEEYAEWWSESERTSYRRQAEFRAAFEGLDDPAPIVATMSPEAVAKLDGLVDALNEAIAERKRGPGVPTRRVVAAMSELRVAM